MNLREATRDDISAMHAVRLSVKENVLSDPSIVKESDYLDYIDVYGKAWVCESGGELIGFAIVDIRRHEVWALFISPAFEGKGAGKQLHDMMLQWYFDRTEHPLILSTEPGSRASLFYRMKGWKQVGIKTNGEIVFQMQKELYLK